MKRFLGLVVIGLCLSVYQIEAYDIPIGNMAQVGETKYYYEVNEYGDVVISECKQVSGYNSSFGLPNRDKALHVAFFSIPSKTGSAENSIMAVVGRNALYLLDVNDPLKYKIIAMEKAKSGSSNIIVNEERFIITYSEKGTDKTQEFDIKELFYKAKEKSDDASFAKKAAAEFAEDDARAKAAAQASQPVRVDYNNIYSVFPGAQSAIKAKRKPAWYEILNVSPTANQDEIREAYKKLVLTVHPDKHPGKELQFWSEASKVLNDAKEKKN